MDLLELEKIDASQRFNRHPWELVRKKVLHHFLQSLPEKAVVADVGSGDAYLAKSIALRWPHWSVLAIDTHYSPLLLQQMGKQPANLYLSNSLDSLPFSLPWNGLVLMDVLEHIQEPHHLLEQLYPHIDPQANLVFVTVPAFQTLFTEHDRKLGHFRRYNRRSLLQLMKMAGFEPIESGYFFPTLLLVRAAQKWLRLAPGHSELYNWKAPHWITRFLTAVFWFEFQIAHYLARAGIYLPGLTLYCLCRLPSSFPATTKHNEYQRQASSSF